MGEWVGWGGWGGQGVGGWEVVAGGSPDSGSSLQWRDREGETEVGREAHKGFGWLPCPALPNAAAQTTLLSAGPRPGQALRPRAGVVQAPTAPVNTSTRDNETPEEMER